MKPNLPNPTVLMRFMPGDYRYGDVLGYTDSQMIEFANARVKQEREKLLARLDRHYGNATNMHIEFVYMRSENNKD